MRELKWFKMSNTLFYNRKIRLLERKENGMLLQLAWIKLLCEAGILNDGGRIYVTENEVITIEELAAVIGMPTDLVKEAVDIFLKFDMIIYDCDEGFVIKNYAKFQSGDSPSLDSDDGERESAEETGECVDASSLSVGDKQYKTSEEVRAYQRELKRRRREELRQEKKRALGDPAAKNESSESVPDSQKGVQDNEKSVPDTVPDTDGNSLKYLSLEENREEKNIIDDMRIEERERDSASDCNASYGEDSIKGEPSNCASLTLASPSLTQESKKAINSVKRNLNDAGRGRFRNVFITDDEYSELLQKYPKTTDVLIDDFSSHMKGMGKTYSNHFAMLLRWAKNDYAPKVRGEPEINPSGSSGQGGSDNGEYGRGANAEYGKGYMDKRSYNKPPKTRYGDFDPEEAFRIALERTEKDSLKHKSSESEKG